MKIIATLCWSATVEVEVPENATTDEKQTAIMDAGLEVELDFRHPVIADCSDEACID